MSTTSRLNYALTIQLLDATGQPSEPPYLESRPRVRARVLGGLRQFVPANNDNWSRLAWRTTGSGRHWWAIADVSGVVDPLTELHKQDRVSYIARLTSSLTAGSTTSLTVDSTRLARKGDTLLVEDLVTGNSVEVVVTGKEPTTLHVAPVTVPAVTASNSRIIRREQVLPTLLVPGSREALLRFLDFDDTFNVLEPELCGAEPTTPRFSASLLMAKRCLTS